MSATGQSGKTSERGVALITVLWGLTILSLIAMAMLASSVTATRLDHNAWNAARAGAAADAGISRATLSLFDARAAKRWRTDGVARAITFDGVRLFIRVQDESGLIDLNTAAPEVLSRLILSAGAAPAEADRIVTQIMARRQAAQGAHALAFRAVEDLKDLPAMNDALYDRLAPALTVFSGTAAIDPNVAPRAVLLALPGMGTAKIAQTLADRDTAYAKASAELGADAPPVQQGKCFKIIADARLGNTRQHHEAVISITNEGQSLYETLDWR